jgi:hypothetical protein
MLSTAPTVAVSEARLGTSLWWDAALLLACGLGHSVLLLLAGAMPTLASVAIRRFAGMPGCRANALSHSCWARQVCGGLQ